MHSHRLGVVRVLPIVLACAMLLGQAGSAQAQPDPESRTYFEAGFESPLRGDAPLAGYLFLLWNRPRFHHPDVYARVALAPVYMDSEVALDRWPTEGNAVGVGLAGGLLADSFEEFREGQHRSRESFWGHGVEASLSWYALRGLQIADVLPVETTLRVRPRYVIYDRDSGTAPDYRLPPDSTVWAVRAGVRAGGVPPELLPRQALELSLWHEVSYRDEAQSFGLPERRFDTRHWTQRTWARAGATLPVFGAHTASLFLTAGVAEDTDALSVFRLGGSLGMRREFPLLLRGFATDEVFAKAFVLLNAAYWVTLPWTDHVRLGVAFDHAQVDYLSSHGLSRSGLSSVGADVAVTIMDGVTFVTGYGYGIDAPRGGHHGGHEASARLEIQFR